jgi:serine/threonine protein kinase
MHIFALLLAFCAGTPAYMAPELVMQCYDEKCDVWSVGMLAYQLLTGRFP